MYKFNNLLKYMIFFVLVVFLGLPLITIAQGDSVSVAQQHPAKTELSKKAVHLKLGMTKAQVIKLLGPPTWANTDEGVPLTLAWRNGNCNPVVVTFDKHVLVDGWDEGRVECSDLTYTDVPDDQYLCSKQLGLCMIRAPKSAK
ncbi:MAG: hypothetical protein PVI75_06530 [Gammaproteobacteria bacterium]|jgi:hypothetical protein